MRNGDYVADIVVDGHELKEYGIEFETPWRVVCWVASEEGKTFAIKWRCDAETRTEGNVGWVWLDNALGGGLVMFPGRLGDGDTAELSGVDSYGKTRDFMFSRIQTSDDDRLLDKELPQGFGEIALEIENGKLVKDPHFRSRRAGVPTDRLTGSDKFCERSTKAAHHRISLGPVRAREAGRYSHSLIEVNKEPSMFLVFKYRPIGLLRAHNLTPPLVPVPDARLSHKPDPDRSQRNGSCKTKIQEKQNSKKRLRDIKAELSEELTLKRIKHEGSVPRKRSRSFPEVIDLTLTED